jgi:hypothetical protein
VSYSYTSLVEPGDSGNTGILIRVFSGTKSCTGTLVSLEVLKIVGDLSSPSIVFLGIIPRIIGLALISSNPFINQEILLSSGPTQNSQDKFLIDDVAIYRYALPNTKILEHYSSDSYTSPVQISQVDNGELFEFYDTDISKVFSYSYPLNRSWQELITEDLYYEQTSNYIQIKKSETPSSKTVILTDTIYLPAATTMSSSKIDWFGDNGISVETSSDGINYSTCINGESIPQYKSSQFSNSRVLNIRIQLLALI